MFQYTKDAGLAFLQSQLAHIEAKVYEKKYKAITYPNVIPISNEAGEFATSVDYYYIDGRTVAKFIGTTAIDVPISEISMDVISVPVHLGAVGYSYSDEELGQAMMLNRPLVQLKANTARRGYEEHLQTVGMNGDTQNNLPGFIDNANVTSANVVNPGSGTEWVNKTPDQILFDITDLCSDVNVDTLQVEAIDTLALPTQQYNYLNGTRLTYSDLNIMTWLVNNLSFIKSSADIISVAELDGAGAGSTDRMMAYTKDSDKVVMHVPKPLIFHEPVRETLGYKVPGTYKSGGVEFRYPGSARYADGI